MKRRLIHRVLTVVLATTLALTGMPVSGLNIDNKEAVIYAEENSDEDDFDGYSDVIIDTDELAPEPVNAYFADTEPSEYGLISETMVYEDGTPYIPELNPDNEGLVQAAIPSSYDLRTYGRIATAVENQNPTGTCWAHASMAAAESNMIINGLATTSINLSEAHLTWFSLGQGPTATSDPLYGDCQNLGTGCYNNGGNIYYSQATLSRGSGVQYESELPDVSMAASLTSYESQRYVSEGYLVNSDIFDASDFDQHDYIKSHIMNTGALYLSYYDDDSYYETGSSTTGKNYYNYSNIKQTNHAVTIVGWDDDYSSSNFGAKPAGDGAWICKNSWGDWFGDNGYFYISYYDTSVSTVGSIEIVQRNTYGDKIYQYSGDNIGTTYYTSLGSSVACIYTADGNTGIAAIGVDTTVASVPYTVEIYDNVSSSPISGEKIYTTSGTIDYAGYHVIDFSEEITIEDGHNFSVVFTQKKAEAGWARDTYKKTSGKCFTAAYYPSTGKRSSFSESSGYDINIRVLTGTSAPVIQEKVAAVTSDVESGTYSTSQSVSLSTATIGADIYYTLDGTTPTESSFLYAGPITVSSDTTIKAIAVKSGYKNSLVSTFTYTIVNKPVEDDTTVNLYSIFPPFPLSFNSGTDLTYIISSLPGKVSIITDNASYNEATVKWDVQDLKENYDPDKNEKQKFTLKGEVILPDIIKNPYDLSLEVNIDVTVEASLFTLSTPVMWPASGTYTESQLVTLSSFEGADIYYTLDGTVPSKTNGTLYKAAFWLNKLEGQSKTYRVKAVAVKSGYNDSSLLDSTIVIDGTTTDYPEDIKEEYIITFDADGGMLSSKEKTIKLTDGEKVLWPELPTVEKPGYEFVCWSYKGKNIYDGDDASWVKEDITLKPVWDNITLLIGQKYNATDVFAEAMDLNPGYSYRLKLSSSKASVKCINDEFIITAKKSGIVTARLQYKDGRRWRYIDGAMVQIRIVKPIQMVKTIVYNESDSFIDASSIISGLPSAIYNDISWYCKGGAAIIDEDTGILEITGRGVAVIYVTLERDGYSKVYKYKIKIK